MATSHIVRPAQGEYVYTDKSGKLQVPDMPLISFIEGDGTGPDIMKVSIIIIYRLMYYIQLHLTKFLRLFS